MLHFVTLDRKESFDTHQRRRNSRSGDFTWQKSYEKVKDCPVHRNGDGHCSLGFIACDSLKIPGEWQNGLRLILCQIMGLNGRQTAENAPIGRQNCSFTIKTHHFTPPRSPGKGGRMWLRAAATLPVFTRLAWCDVNLFQLKKVTRRTEIWVEWEDYSSNGGLLCRPRKKYFSDELKNLEHRWVRYIEMKGDCTETTNLHFPNILFFSCRLSTVFITLVYTT